MDEKKIPITRSSMPSYEEYIDAIKPLWDSRWLTNMGIYHRKLEKQLKEYLKVPEVSLMVNGHMALELTIQAMEFPPGSEVITTPFTFISTTHAIIRNNLTPVFCDVKESDGTMDENKIEKLITEKTVAIVPVHVYGYICNVEAIDKIAKKYGLKVIYDAAHAFGETYKGIGVGNFGDASVFSFHATKVFHTIEGGAVVFSDHNLYEKLYNLKNFGIRGEELVTDVGANAKMNEFAAIMGLCNLKYIEKEIIQREKRVKYYQQLIENIDGVRLFATNPGVKYNYAYFPIRICERERAYARERVYEYMRKFGVMVRKYFFPLVTDQVCFGDKYKHSDIAVARKVSKEVLILPLYSELDLETIKDISELIMQAVQS